MFFSQTTSVFICDHSCEQHCNGVLWDSGSKLCICPQSLVLSIAKTVMEKEVIQIKVDKENYMTENCPPLSLPGSTAELQVCFLIHDLFRRLKQLKVLGTCTSLRYLFVYIFTRKMISINVKYWVYSLYNSVNLLSSQNNATHTAINI